MAAALLTSLFSLWASGSEEGAVVPPLPRGVSAPGRVRLHGCHAALPLRLHHHLHRASQVRGNVQTVVLTGALPSSARCRGL